MCQVLPRRTDFPTILYQPVSLPGKRWHIQSTSEGSLGKELFTLVNVKSGLTKPARAGAATHRLPTMGAVTAHHNAGKEPGEVTVFLESRRESCGHGGQHPQPSLRLQGVWVCG